MNDPKIKILIVEDEAMIALDIKEKLTELGYIVTQTADTGAKAIQYAGETMPDIVLMDIVIKGEMDGIEAAMVIKEKFNIPSLFLTAYSSGSVIERAKKVNPIGYLLKPFDDTKLQDVILEMYIQGTITEKGIRPK
ncbi:MAG: response regulator [Ignavibacteria bacterium]